MAQGFLPLPPISQQGDGRLMCTGAREEIPCHVYALHALEVAVTHGMRWIRIHKQGHACEYDVNTLVAQCERNPLGVPRALIFTKAEHDAVGNWTDTGRELWPGGLGS